MELNVKLVDISTTCYAHLMDNTIYLYVDGEFTEILYADGIEAIDNPIPLIMHEIELSSKASLYECMQFI